MKVFLLGEFSGLYKNLSEGLSILGHDVKHASWGDGWKQIESKITFPTLKLNGNIFDKIEYRINLYKTLFNIKDNDVLQLINPNVIFFKWFPYYQIINNLMKNNKKIFLSAAGDDAFFWKYGRDFMRTQYFNDVLKFDIKANKSFYEGHGFYLFNKYIADKCNGIIPIMYEYEMAYKNHTNIRKTIPIPINTEKINYSPNIVKDRIVIFHGLNRYGAKGTYYVEKSFEILKKKYPNDLDLIIDGKMPFNIYLDVIKRTNIIIDQVHSFSCGMNALYGLAMGKIVLGGAMPESFPALGIENSPVINITPNVEDIVTKLEFIIEKRKKFEELGFKGRAFVEKVHNYIKIAQNYIDIWLQN